MERYKGYEVRKIYPEDGWLKGYFYTVDEDIKNATKKSEKCYQDIGYIKHKDFILNLINVCPADKILDMGCSEAAMAVYCGLLGAEVSAVDISQECIEKANKNFQKFNIKASATLADARSTGFKDNYFDKIISCDFFEHLCEDDSIKVLKEAKRILKPGGIMVIRTPNLTYLRLSKLYKQLRAIIKLRNPLSVIIAHTVGSSAEHIGLKTHSQMGKMIDCAGFINYQFYYDVHSKFRKSPLILRDILTNNYFLKYMFSEDVIVVLYKPIILSLFD